MEQLSFTQFIISLFRQHKEMPKVWEIALGEQGMRFNLESNCLEPIIPIFKKGDKITKDGTIITILDVLSGGYLCDNGIIIPVYLQDKWKLYTFNLETGKYYVCTRDWDKSSGLWHKGGVYLCQNDHFLVADNGNLYPWYSNIHLKYFRPATEKEQREAEIKDGKVIVHKIESEDERIRKQITGFITYSRVLDETKKIWLAWLEKQGAHAEFLDKIQIGDKVTRNEDGVLINLSQLKRVAKKDEKQGEQNPYGQRQECVDCQMNYAGECKGSCAMKRGEQKPVEPMIVGQEPLYDYTNANICQKDFAEQKPVDFSDLRTWKYIIDTVLTEKEGIGQYLDSPFTEEVAKKLQKRFGNIEPKPTDTEKGANGNEREIPNSVWSEEDEENRKNILYILNQLKGTAIYKEDKTAENCIDWLKSLKDRVQPKQEWSEEDETTINNLVWAISNDCIRPQDREDYCDWLKSLRPQNTWKPSDEQMITLRHVISGCSYDIEPLVEMKEQLKKLRGGDV